VARLRLPLALAVAALWGCAEQPEPDPTPRPLRIALGSAPVSLDPHLQDERTTRAVLDHIFESLSSFDADMRLRPALAASWDNPADDRWRFRLRPGVVFHDGRLLTADDVIASLERARLHPQSQVASFLVDVVRLERVDDLTVDVVTRSPAPLLAARLSFVAIVPAGVGDRITQPVGTGPWRFLDTDATGLRLEPHRRHRDGLPAWSAVAFSFVDSAEERVRRLVADEVDIAATLDPAAEDAAAGAGMAVAARAGLSVTFLGMRVDRPPFDRLELRRAIDLALDRDAIVHSVLRGRAVPASQVTSPAVFGHAPDLAPTRRNLAAARALLAQLPPPGPLELTHPPGLGPEAGAIASQLNELGLEVAAAEVPWQALYERVASGQETIFLAGYGCDSGSASDIFDGALHTTDPSGGYGATNFMGYSDAAFDSLVETANATLDERARGQLLEEASRLLARELPVLPLWTAQSVAAVRPGLSWRPRLDRKVLAHEVLPPGSR
jgi:peptide/nickel transport system substrate-binding protein